VLVQPDGQPVISCGALREGACMIKDLAQWLVLLLAYVALVLGVLEAVRMVRG
jgi:hypothetical protein